MSDLPVDPLPVESPTQSALAAHFVQHGMRSCRFVRTPDTYYTWSLAKRARLLGCEPSQLCKTIVLENIWTEAKDCSDPTDSRFYCVVLQYVAKLDPEQLMRALRDLRPKETRLSRRSVKFRLARSDVSDELTGFEHNAVTPFLCRTPIPVILAKAVAELPHGYFWIGGGEVTLKLGVGLDEFLANTRAFVLPCSDPRSR
jgi:prolyl-tRNA editing enzyme YbaK/EbsC (Cys-tRNA(Pro) deacylase)